MPSRYHPLEEGLWDDPKFDPAPGVPDAPFEERAFFAYLFSNPRQRPSGVYRVTDGQLAEGSRLPLKRVVAYLADLHRRALIVRDGAWIFLPGYLKRQSHGPRLLVSAERDVQSCESIVILNAFAQSYPLFNKWSKDRLETVTRRSGNGVPNLPPQSSTRAVPEQSRAPSKDGLETVKGFDRFWGTYPRKVGRVDALKAWGKVQPDEALVLTILAALSHQRMWPMWTKNGGESIPYPATWLNGRRWEDEAGIRGAPEVLRPKKPASPTPEAQDLTPEARALIRGVIESLPEMPTSERKEPW